MTKESSRDQISSVFLGTAGWGQKIAKTEAYRILETFYGHGFRWVDTATNYPIDRNPENYGETIEWLSDFCSDFSELKIFVKAGSATNKGESRHLINASYFALVLDLLFGRLGDCLGGLGIHWDNGVGDTDRVEIIDLFSNINDRGLAIGLSGISNPEIYSNNPIARGLPWIYQINMSPIRFEQISQELDTIRSNFPKSRVYGYNLLGGIAAKGLRDDGDRSSVLNKLINGPTSANKDDLLGQIVSKCLSLAVDGLVIGPASAVQCLEWCVTLDRFHLG